MSKLFVFVGGTMDNKTMYVPEVESSINVPIVKPLVISRYRDTRAQVETPYYKIQRYLKREFLCEDKDRFMFWRFYEFHLDSTF